MVFLLYVVIISFALWGLLVYPGLGVSSSLASSSYRSIGFPPCCRLSSVLQSFSLDASPGVFHTLVSVLFLPFLLAHLCYLFFLDFGCDDPELQLQLAFANLHHEQHHS